MTEVIATIVFAIITIGLAFWAETFSCERRWEGSGIESKWSIGAGCRVKVNGVWLPENRYRKVD